VVSVTNSRTGSGRGDLGGSRVRTDARGSQRLVGEQALSRAAGAPLVPGNRVRLLRDATENYPAWLTAIERASRSVLLETYIFADDPAGNRFADALVSSARRGVRVRVLHDWLGDQGEAGRRFWRRLERAGVEVRTFNPFRIDAPLAWLRRDHRKSLVVDGRVGFVTGLCIAARWEGAPERGLPPWRDTGVEIEGPAVGDLVTAFAAAWAEAGPPLPPEEDAAAAEAQPAGQIALRVVATEPATAGLYRLDQLVAALARSRVWITDAYFVGVPSYVQALRAAAADGVDVRLLVPGTSDLGIVKRLGVAGYRPLLESGARVFEWNGPMLHAKTAVADGRWARVGSSNLNLASWMGNWELDVAVEDEGFAGEMEAAFEQDLRNATEIVLGAPRGLRGHAPEHPAARRREREGSAVAAAGALRLGSAVGAALGGRRVLGPADGGALAWTGVALLCAALVAALFPRAALVPVIVIEIWFGVALIGHAIRMRCRRARPAEPDGNGTDGPRRGSSPALE
jgi:cardiolipin synthase